MAYIVPMHVKPKFTYLLTRPQWVNAKDTCHNTLIGGGVFRLQVISLKIGLFVCSRTRMLPLPCPALRSRQPLRGHAHNSSRHGNTQPRMPWCMCLKVSWEFWAISCFSPCGAKTRMFWYDLVNIMAAYVLVSYMARLSATMVHIDGSVQDCSFSIALEILQSCTKPSIYWLSRIHKGSLSSIRKESNHMCHLSVEKWLAFPVTWKKIPAQLV